MRPCCPAHGHDARCSKASAPQDRRFTDAKLPEDRPREKLRKIEALYAGVATAGEVSAAGAAADRSRRLLKAASVDLNRSSLPRKSIDSLA